MSLEAPALVPRPSLQRLFLTGLLTLLPIWLTWVVVKFVFVLLSGISSPLVVPLSEQIATSFRTTSAGSAPNGSRTPSPCWPPCW
jgi:uncharacterized membrane protein